MKKYYFLLFLGLLITVQLQAQLPGWAYYKAITVTNNTASPVANYQLPIVINTQDLIAAGRMQANGNDIRFGSDCTGTTLYPYYIDTGINTTATRLWVKIDALPASASKVIFIYYGNSAATPASTISIFAGPFSSTNQISGGSNGGTVNSQRGFRFSPNTDILVTQFGKNEPQGSQRYVTLFDFTTQAIVKQAQVSGPAGTYSYSTLSSPVWLTQNQQYLFELTQGASDGYYFQPSSQINSNLTYYDMRYCNSCDQNDFPTSVLGGYHYGYPDFQFYTRNLVTPAPTYSINGSGSQLLYVDAAIPASGDGSSWASAFKTLNEALALANGSVCTKEIWVKQGTYYPTTGTNRDSSFRVLENGTKVYGGFAGTETQLSQRNVAANPTILSGDIGVANDSTDNSYHVVTVISTATNLIDTTTRIDGFTIRDGNATGGASFAVRGVTLNQVDGGGMHLAGMGAGNVCSPALENNTFTRNTATYGGGLYLGGYGGGTSSPYIANCTFTLNTAIIYGGGLTSIGEAKRNKFSIASSTFNANKVSLAGTFGGGGAIYTRASLMTITASTITANTGNCAAGIKADGGITTVSNTAFTNNKVPIQSNTTNYSGAEVYNTGGAAIFHGAGDTSSYTNCTFTGNTAYNGNAVFLTSIGSAGTFVKLNTCKFTGNTGGYWGGVMANYYSAEVQSTNCVFSNNSVPGYGGVIDVFSGSKATFIQCVAAGNSASGTGGFALNEDGSTLNILNSTLSNNTSGSAPYSIDGNGTPATFLTNTIVWGTSNGSHLYTTGATLNNSLVRGITVTAPNLSVDPYFVNAGNAIGADNIWGTADDGLHLTPCSEVINKGNNALIPAGLTTDFTGVARIQQAIVEMGAYESPVLPLTIIKSHTNVVCRTAATGTATIAVTGGSNTYTYSWNSTPVQTTAIATGLPAGIYTVTITDQSGCFVTRTDTITQPATVVSTSISAQTDVLCKGAATGSATILAAGGTPGYTYSWAPSGGSAATATGLAAGTYTVTVKDASLCATTQSVVIGEPSTNITTSISSSTNVLCFGNATGAATALASGGTGTLTYSWNTTPVQTTATATGLAAGTYTVTVKDANLCTKTQNVTITQPATGLTATATKTNALCFGAANGTATAVPAGGTGPYTYSWNTTPVQTTITATGLAAGSYTVTVTDAGTCTATATATVGQPAGSIVLTPSQTNVICFGAATGTATISATGGSPGYTYSWNTTPVQTTATATGLAAGTYTVTVKDANLCQTTQNFTITQPATGVSVSISSSTNVLCKGAATGAATAAGADGVSPYTYSWNTTPVQTTATATGLIAGTYIVTAKDANLCTGTQSVVITEPATSISTSISSSTNVLCFGNSTGAATVLATGGTGTLSYSWNTTPVQTTATATGLAAGTYIATVTDANLCTKTQSVTITQPAAGLTATTTKTNALCFGAANGTATAVPAGGTGPYTYSWNTTPVQTTITATGLIAGTYTVTVKDAGNCTTTATATITQPAAAVTLTPSQTNPLCFGAATGTATVVAAGGTTPYTYSWTGSASTTATASGLTAGTYVVTVKDANLCQTTQSFTITQPAVLATSIGAQTNVNCFGGNTGAATVAVTGGTGAYTYSWNTTPVQTTVTATGLVAGTYVVTVKDANLCQTTQSVTITQPAAALAATAAAPVRVCAGNALNITSTVSGGTTPYTYSWTGPNSFTSTAANPSFTSAQVSMGGTYNLTVTDAKNCTTTASATTAVDTIAQQPGNISGAPAVCANSVTVYSITAVPTATSYTWTLPTTPTGWTGTSATTSISATAPATSGTGIISVAAVNNCGTSLARTLNLSVVNKPLQPGVIAGDAAVCGGISKLYSITPVPEATSYTWTVPTGWTVPSPSSIGSFINSSAPTVTGTGNGTITVTASNFCGTSAARTFIVAVTNIPAQPAAINGLASVCGGTAQVYKIPKVTEATSYNWTVVGNGWTSASGAPTDTFVNATAGTADNVISVTATNQCGTGTARTLAITVTNKPGAAGVILGPDSICTGAGAITYTTGQINEATSYIWTLPTGWSGTSTTQSISGTPGGAAAIGTVNITVTGSNTCGTGTTTTKAVTLNRAVTPSVTMTGSPTGAVCAGTPITYTTTGVNGGSSPPYQWKVNNVNAGPASGTNTFTTSTLNSGDVVSVVLKTSLPCATTAGGLASVSAPAQMIRPMVMPGVNINATTPPDLCKDASVTFYSNVTSGGDTPLYQWWKNGIAITGSTGANYTINTLNNGDSIRVVLTSNALCRMVDTVSSNKIGVSVSPYLTPVITISANPGTLINTGQTVIFTASISNAGANPEIRWKRNGQTVAGTTGLTWTTTTLRDGDAIGAELVSGAKCATPFLVVSNNTLTMKVGTTGIGSTVSSTLGTVNLYPNPTTGKFTVSVKGGSASSNISGKRIKLNVVNAIGQVVYTSAVRPDTKDWSVDVRLEDNVANGVYMLKVGVDETDVQTGSTGVKEQPTIIRFELNR